VNLTWSAVSGAASYDIEAGSSTGLADLAVLNTTALGLTTTAGPGTYYVRVRARNAAGVSTSSNEVIITIGGCSAPVAPSGLALQSAVGGTVVLIWMASPGDVSSYIVEAGSSPGRSDLANADLGTSATTLTATGVSSGVYYVRMKARNACGVSAPSNEIHITVP